MQCMFLLVLLALMARQRVRSSSWVEEEQLDHSREDVPVFRSLSTAPNFYQDDPALPRIVKQMLALGRTVRVYVPKEYFGFEGSKWDIPQFMGKQV